MPEEIAVVGANGQLGADIVSVLREGYIVHELNHGEYDCTRKESFVSFFQKNKITWLVNTAAYHNVELCETNPDKAFLVNAIGTRNLAELARDTGASFIHVSTDYVFGGTHAVYQKPYVEEDAPDPVNAYGTSKLAGEHMALYANDKTSILRVSGLYGVHPCRA